jgi:hypothetical protein
MQEESHFRPEIVADAQESMHSAGTLDLSREAVKQ